MRPEKFWILVALSLMIAVLILLEISNERKTLKLTYEENVAQGQVAEAQQQHEVLIRLLQKMAFEAQTDSAFQDLLTKRGVVRSSPGGAANEAASQPAPASAPSKTTSPAP